MQLSHLKSASFVAESDKTQFTSSSIFFFLCFKGYRFSIAIKGGIVLTLPHLAAAAQPGSNFPTQRLYERAANASFFSLTNAPVHFVLSASPSPAAQH